jgi:hypothetical protein
VQQRLLGGAALVEAELAAGASVIPGAPRRASPGEASEVAPDVGGDVWVGRGIECDGVVAVPDRQAPGVEGALVVAALGMECD